MQAASIKHSGQFNYRTEHTFHIPDLVPYAGLISLHLRHHWFLVTIIVALPAFAVLTVLVRYAIVVNGARWNAKKKTIVDVIFDIHFNIRNYADQWVRNRQKKLKFWNLGTNRCRNPISFRTPDRWRNCIGLKFFGIMNDQKYKSTQYNHYCTSSTVGNSRKLLELILYAFWLNKSGIQLHYLIEVVIKNTNKQWK